MTAPAHRPRPDEALTRRIVGIETEYGLTTLGGLGQEEAARYLFRPVVARYSSSNIFTLNGSRLYLDIGSHPEYATAECDSLDQLIAHERAGDIVMNRLAMIAEEAMHREGIADSIFLFKNNVDSVGNSYGCHENYLLRREVVLKSLSERLLPFLITRQLICGAGTIRDNEFLLSQRAYQVHEGISSATTRSRPIINTRDEPHADSSRFRRMHVIVGDSNIAEPTLALKVGATLLVLEMIEAGWDLPEYRVIDPISHIRAITHDLTGATPIRLAEGTTTALSIQRSYCAAAESWLGARPVQDEALARVVDLWRRTVDAIDSGDFSGIDTEIDWVIKRTLLDAYRARLGESGEGWGHPRLRQLDLAYHDIRPGRGLGPLLAERGRMSRWIPHGEAEAAVNQPPATTRAAARGRFLACARETGAPVTTDWLRMKVNRPEPQLGEFPDPFEPNPHRLTTLIDYMRAHRHDYR